MIHHNIFLFRVEFTLDDQYDITWHLPPKMEHLPLFQTSSFDIVNMELELMGGVDGKSYVFEVRALKCHAGS